MENIAPENEKPNFFPEIRQIYSGLPKIRVPFDPAPLIQQYLIFPETTLQYTRNPRPRPAGTKTNP